MMNQTALGLADDQYVIGTYPSRILTKLSNGSLRLIIEMLTVVFEEGRGHMTYPYQTEFIFLDARLISGQMAQDGTIIVPAKLLARLPDTGELVVVEIVWGVVIAKVRLTKKFRRQMARKGS